MSYIGTIKIGQMYLGSIKIGKAYLGGTLVFSGEVPVVIVFEDPNVEAIAVVQWGNGTTLTERQAAAVTALNNAFKNNTNIISFNELEYFTGLTGIMGYTGAGGNVTGQFYQCTSLEEIALSSNVVTIDHGCFRGCTSLETVSGGALTTINSYAFYGCSSLTSINLSSVTSIGNYAFTNASLDGFTLHCPNLTSLGQMAFRNTKLYSVTSLGTITSIPADNGGGNGGCFAVSTYLESVTLPSTLTTISGYAFNGCTSLVSINLGNVTSIGRQGFMNTDLTGLVLDCPYLTELGQMAFRNAKLLKVTSLGTITEFTADSSGANGGTFGNCTSLTEVTLPETLTSIPRYTFTRCSSLTTVKILATTPPTLVNVDAFGNNASTRKFYVPYSANHSVLAAYQAASNWSSFASVILELDSNGNIPV